MNFLRLNDDLLSVIYEDEDIIALDKPYGFNAHTNDAKADHGAAIEDGLIEIYEKNRGAPLHIIHRLDQTTTGVMIFGKSVEAAKKYADYFLNRQVKKTYWFITQSKSKAKNFVVDQPIIHKAKELEAKTEMSLLKAEHGYELWQANPFTGRNHQIRIHAQFAGLSLLGDEKYGGAKYPFLTLHNRKIQFPNGISIESKPPVYFETLSWLADPILANVFFEADRRYRLFVGRNLADQCFRLVNHVNGAKEPGYTLDQFGPYLVLNWYRDEWTPANLATWIQISTSLNIPIWVYGKDLKHGIRVEPSDDPWCARELNTEYELTAEASSAVGLYLNQRLQRKWVKENAKGKTVLNLFSNTGTYGLSAALGHAREVTLVDTSKNNLAWSKRNFQKNGLNTELYKFLNRDSLTFVETSLAKKTQFDIIVCDTPTFFRREKGIFRVEKGLEKLVADGLALLAPDGVLLVSTQFDGFFIDDLRRMIIKVQKALSLSGLQINLVLPSMDFERPHEKTNLKSFILKRI